MQGDAVTSDFNVVEHKDGAAIVLAASGELDLRTSPQLERRLDQALATGSRLVVLDLREIEFMDSSGLRVLLSTHQRARERGGRFALVRGAEQVERVLRLTGVTELLTIVDSPQDLMHEGESSDDGA